MAKRTKKSKSSRSNLRVETLEQRQLLATIVAGSGTEVASNVQLPNGTYDQILMTGASVTVSADPGEVVRVSFLDQGGDIVQAEFGGAGTMTVSLEDVKTAASAGYVNKNPDQFLNGNKINYVQGLATITVDKPELNSNLGVYAAGILQNPGFFTGQAKQGDNGLADVARVILVGNPNNEAGYSNMGGIRMGGAVFSASSGVVGIRGENVAIQNIVAIGDIDAKESGVPTLMFNSNSQVQTVFVRGGDLRQSNGTSFNSFGAGNPGAPGGSPGEVSNITLGGFSFFNSTDGTTSQNVKLWATPVSQSAIRLATVDQQTLISGDWTFDWTNAQAVKVTQNGVDVSSVYGGDWLAKGGIQASLDYAFERRTFQGDITIKGDLPANFEMNVADARGDVTFENNLYGRFTVDGFGASIDGTLTVMGNLDGTVIVQGLDRTGGFDGQQNKIGAIMVGGSTGPFTDVRAEDIGNITIVGSMSGIFSTDVTRGNAWTPTSGALTGTGYVDVEGFIGDISVGYNAAGASTGGSIINGTFQGNSGIGNVKVGGDIYGTPVNQAVFETVSNSGAAPTDVRNYGSANVGSITVRGDVDLDNSDQRLVFINGNGTFGNIKVDGLTTTNTVPGPQTGTKTDLIPGSETFVRILSPFTDVGFVTNPAIGQKLVQNYDPDGVAGALNDTYFVTKADVAAGAQIYDIATAKMVAAKEGDRVPALSGGLPIIDTFGNVLYRQNTALFEGKTQTVPVFGPDVVTIVSGNRGNLNGVFNNFGRIEIAGLLGAQQKTTGTISWTDSVDMNFGGVTVNSSGNANNAVIGTVGTIGQITINNTSGATSDLILSGQIGSANGAGGANNAGTAFVGLTGIASGGFEDVRVNSAIRAVDIKNGIAITTVTGVGNGTGVGTVSPSVVFNNIINLDDGTNEGTQKALLSINAGSVNSTIGFTNAAGIVVDNNSNTSNGSEIEALSLSADYVYFNGTLQANKIGALTLTGGKGIGSNSDTGVSFTGTIRGNTVGAITGSASEGNVVFAPTVLTGLATKGTNDSLTPVAEVASINLTTAGNNNGGDITLGNFSTTPAAGLTTQIYNANIGDITLQAGHKLAIGNAGTIIDNPGNININLGTSGNIGNLTATTTSGNITNELVVRGNAGNISYTAGVVVVDKADLYAGPEGDIMRAGNIKAEQAIYGTRGVTSFSVANTPVTATIGGVSKTYNPAGTIVADLVYAGASTAATNALTVSGSNGAVTVNEHIVGFDDNNDGVVSQGEIGHGGNSSLVGKGAVTFNASSALSAATDVDDLFLSALPLFTHTETMGNVVITASGAATVSFNGAAGGNGFEGKAGNITVTGAGATFGASAFASSVGMIGLTATGSTAVTSAGGVVFNGAHGAVAQTSTSGTNTANYTSNGPSGGGYTFLTTSGNITATVNAGRFDANNNGQFTSDEYGRTGAVIAGNANTTGAITLNLGSLNRASDIEQSVIGDVTATTKVNATVRNGQNDTFVAGSGNITINGTDVDGAVGNITGTTDAGVIAHTGLFGDVGDVTFNITKYDDVDTNPNSLTELPVTIRQGSIALGNGATGGDQGTTGLFIRGKHGLATYMVNDTVTTGIADTRTISGTVYYGGAATTETSLIAKTALANINLEVNLTNARGGTQGKSMLTSTAGDITLLLGTDIGAAGNTEATPTTNLFPALKFGAVEAVTGDYYQNALDAAAADNPTLSGDITITGIGKDITSAGLFGQGATFGYGVFGNRGDVESVKADVTRGAIALNGTFGGLGDQMLTAGSFLDDVGANDRSVSGTIAYSPTIFGSHGTATLRTTEQVPTGTGAYVGGGITGTATFGGALAAGKTTSIDAMTGRANIGLTVLATGYDINNDARVTDGSNNNIPGNLEFAQVGALKLETTNAGDIALSVAARTTDSSTIGATIGNITAIADDDKFATVDNNNDTIIDQGNITITGAALAADMTGGTIGDISMTVLTGTNTLTGNFVNIGGVTMNSGTYTDTGAAPAGVIFAGNIVLGNGGVGDFAFADTTGLNTLNIAGSFNASTLTVVEMGTIKGEVFSAGTAGQSWTLNAGRGAATAASATANGASGLAIDVNFVAGFDRNDTDGNGITGIENGTIGNIVASSTFGDVVIGVGGRSSGSSVGSVTVTTGSSIVEVSGTDKFTHGTAEIQGLSSHLANNVDAKIAFSGSVGALTASSPFGTAQITGDFNTIGAVTLAGDAKVDADSDSTVGTEDTIVSMAGDVFFGTGANPVYVAGDYGTISLTTKDASVLSAALQAKSGALVGNFGTIRSTAFFAGGTAGAFNATSERGLITLDVEAGFDKDNDDLDGSRSTGEESGKIGALTVLSGAGDITLTLDSSSRTSTIGAVNLTTGSVITSLAGADTIVQQGSIMIQGDNDTENANGNLGTVESISATAATGNVTLNGIQWSVGAINLLTGSNVDLDRDSTVVAEDPFVNAAGDIILGYTGRTSHGTITATTSDLSSNGVFAGTLGEITGSLTFTGALAAGSTNSFVASTQQGEIDVSVTAGNHEKIADTGVTVGNGANNADNFVGAVGGISLTSLFGDINLDIATTSLTKSVSDTAIRFSSIGDITATTATSIKSNAGASNDIKTVGNYAGDISIGVGDTSNGILGNITATATLGNINIGTGGTFNNVVGNVQATTSSYSDTTVLFAGNVSFGGSFATINNSGDTDTTLGTVTLNAAGSIDNAGIGAAGNVIVNANFGGKWTDGDADVAIDAGEQLTFAGGAFNATVTDGQISYTVGSETGGDGFGAALPVTLLKSTGGSTNGATGAITTAGAGTFSGISSFKAETAEGSITYGSDWETPTVSLFTLTSDKGSIFFDGRLELDTANASNFNTTQAIVDTFTLWAKNGAVEFGTSTAGGATVALLGSDVLNRTNLVAANDTRTFVLKDITLKSQGASGGVVNVGASVGSIGGIIGGRETTTISNLVFDVPALTGSTSIDGPGAAAAVVAHDMTKITFNGNAQLLGGTVILASDVGTSRTRIGSADYDANTAGNADNKGANLDVISELIFNGSVTGSAAASLITGSRAEIEASAIGSITINAPVDPTTTVTYSVQDLDILASNSRGGVAQGEALNVAGVSTLDAPNAITAFAIGNVSVRHLLQGNSVGSTVFAGSSAIAGIGGLGNITVTSTVSGTVQAPMLTAAGGAWFAVGDADGLGNGTATFDSSGNGVLAAYDDVATGTGAGDKVSIGAVVIDVGSSYAPPAVQNQDFGNVGGNNAVAADGLAILAAAIAPTVADTAATRAAAATELYGYITSVEIKNAGIRPNADGTDFAVTAGNAFGGNAGLGNGNLGALIAVAGDGDNTTSDIGDIINDLNPALVPLVEGQGRILGQVGNLDEYDQHEVVVYVL